MKVQCKKNKKRQQNLPDENNIDEREKKNEHV